MEVLDSQMELDGHLKIKKNIQISFKKSDVDYPLKLKYKISNKAITWKLQMNLDKDDKNFKRRSKDSRRKQESEFYLWDLRMAGRKKKNMIYLIIVK